MKKSTLIKLTAIVLCGIAALLFTMNDYFLYQRSIGTITAVENQYLETRTGTDGEHEYKEDYYLQIITLTLRNGDCKGETLQAENRCTASGVYDTRYQEGDDVFVENIEPASGQNTGLTGDITGTKRDVYVVLISVLLLGCFIAVGGKEGILTILSLLLNVAAFYLVLRLYLRGVNILLMTVPMVIFFSAMLLLFLYGKNKKTLISFIAVLLSVTAVTLLALVVLRLSPDVDYDFMDYLVQPYAQLDADCIFLSEILIGCLGAIMDIVVTIVMTVDQITRHNPQISTGDLLKSCRTVGDDVVGTMIGVMFFTNIAAAIPFILLSMRNGIAFSTILRYHSFFELSRFLTGCIGIVIAIPVSAAAAVYFYKHTRRKTSC